MHIYVQKDTQFIQYKIQMNPRSVRGPLYDPIFRKDMHSLYLLYY